MSRARFTREVFSGVNNFDSFNLSQSSFLCIFVEWKISSIKAVFQSLGTRAEHFRNISDCRSIPASRLVVYLMLGALQVGEGED